MDSTSDRQQLREVSRTLKLLKKEQAERREEIKRLNEERKALRGTLGLNSREADDT